jgi:hypothetical protein
MFPVSKSVSFIRLSARQSVSLMYVSVALYLYFYRSISLSVCLFVLVVCRLMQDTPNTSQILINRWPSLYFVNRFKTHENGNRRPFNRSLFSRLYNTKRRRPRIFYWSTVIQKSQSQLPTPSLGWATGGMRVWVRLAQTSWFMEDRLLDWNMKERSLNAIPNPFVSNCFQNGRNTSVHFE